MGVHIMDVKNPCNVVTRDLLYLFITMDFFCKAAPGLV